LSCPPLPEHRHDAYGDTCWDLGVGEGLADDAVQLLVVDWRDRLYVYRSRILVLHDPLPGYDPSID
jgi:hypothetical protein